MQTPQAGRLWQESAPARQTAAFWRVLYSRTLFCTKFRAVTLVSDRTGRSVAVNVETFGNVRALTDRFSLCYLYFTSVLWVRFKMLIGGTVPCAWWSACSATGFRCPGIASARTAKRVYERTPSSIKITAQNPDEMVHASVKCPGCSRLLKMGTETCPEGDTFISREYTAQNVKAKCDRHAGLRSSPPHRKF